MREEEIVVSAEVWSIISVGIVILITIATSNRALRREMGELRRELGEVRRELGGRIDELSGRLDELSDRITAVRVEMIERFREVGERLARVEGVLESIVLRRWARDGKGRSDEEHGQALPRP